RINMISNLSEKRSRFGWMAALIIALLCAAALTDAADQERKVAPAPAPKPATATGERDAPLKGVNVAEEKAKSEDNAATLAQLDRKLPEVKFDAVAFSDSIDWMRDVTGANIFVNWRALEAAGIDKNTPVSARLRDVK